MKPKIFGPSPRRWSWYRGDGAWPGSALRALPALLIGLVLELGHRFLPGLVGGMDGALVCLVQKLPRQAGFRLARGQRLHQLIPGRSEERRVGKEGRSRWSPYDYKEET